MISIPEWSASIPASALRAQLVKALILIEDLSDLISTVAPDASRWEELAERVDSLEDELRRLAEEAEQ